MIYSNVYSTIEQDRLRIIISIRIIIRGVDSGDKLFFYLILAIFYVNKL